ncbi:hypothetical protein AMAG_18517 [Allomyces macrogynus ATCC 38327]|uniref:Uncharacterized protein n=1 Tax=Allomyces macrogynus (strain ATCC 38327) TaxID=578462 RepID=A0A0L0SCX9_ALLM3|nr:hypothetical protein AMAG_18517 [Allomyces macrogynus ATCC 38327]|eukprot:KNE60336.1 hypothetical protein AMAG_18517 [Allomyces macrogynus ATCC 38327]
MPASTTSSARTSSSSAETSASAPSSAAAVAARVPPSTRCTSSTPAPETETSAGAEQPPPHPRLDPIHLARQEASYIAASHRADRPLAARLESAAQASALHALRTGKRLFVSRVLVERRRDYPEERHDVVVRAAKVHARAVRRRRKDCARDGKQW